MSYRVQSPGEKLDYGYDYATEFTQNGSPTPTISTSSWTLLGGVGSPAPVVDGAVNDNTKTLAYLSGLDAGEIYRLINIVVDTDGRRYRRSWAVRCEKR